jgi:Dyp-type peroxidase family
MVAEAVTLADLRDIQGLVYSAWNKHSHAAFMFVRLGASAPTARGWLAAALPHVTPASRDHRPHERRRYQVALSASGLRKLGAPATVTSGLPEEATQGMWERKQYLGDDDAPPWEFGDRGDELDAVVLLYALDDDDRTRLIAEETARVTAAGGVVVTVQSADQLVGREHFGFADGLSQPFLRAPAGAYDAAGADGDEIAPGEILLGYKNAYGRPPGGPRWTEDDDSFGKNGTYLVFRKLEQDVPAFWQWLAQQAAALTDADRDGVVGDPVEWLAAKMMGRWRSGASLVLSPNADVSAGDPRARQNDFAYHDKDPAGLACPIASHVRRANPRDARGSDAADSLLVVQRHRIIRRGRSYGVAITPEDAKAHVACATDEPRGLYFLCLQSSIARGFEFIQQSWLSSSGFNSLHDEVDPITGHARLMDGTESPRHFTIPREPLRLRLDKVPRVVRTRGGGYFFMPSLSALRRLVRG